MKGGNIGGMGEKVKARKVYIDLKSMGRNGSKDDGEHYCYNNTKCK